MRAEAWGLGVWESWCVVGWGECSEGFHTVVVPVPVQCVRLGVRLLVEMLAGMGV